MTLARQIERAIAPRVKAVVAGAASAVVSYVALAIVTGTVWTLHGVEVAAATAVLTALGVHRAPANRPAKKAKKA